MLVRISGHCASSLLSLCAADGKARWTSVSASQGSSSVSKPWAGRPTATGPRATRPTALGYGPKRPGSRQGLVSIHVFVRRRPAEDPTGLGRDSCPTTEPSVRQARTARTARTARMARRGPASAHTAVCRWASRGRRAAREPHWSTGPVSEPLSQSSREPDMAPCPTTGVHRLAFCPPLPPPYVEFRPTDPILSHA
jgi:hypothetical protein